MSEQQTDLHLKDFLNLPDGREEYAKHMLDSDKKESTLDPRFTNEENLELYRLQFDRAILSRKFDNKQISGFELDTQNDVINDKAEAILQASYQHRKSE